MKRVALLHSLLLLLLVLVAAGVSGCATDESDNASVRPWNSPRGPDTGNLPSSMIEGR